MLLNPEVQILAEPLRLACVWSEEPICGVWFASMLLNPEVQIPAEPLRLCVVGGTNMWCVVCINVVEPRSANTLRLACVWSEEPICHRQKVCSPAINAVDCYNHLRCNHFPPITSFLHSSAAISEWVSALASQNDPLAHISQVTISNLGGSHFQNITIQISAVHLFSVVYNAYNRSFQHALFVD